MPALEVTMQLWAPVQSQDLVYTCAFINFTEAAHLTVPKAIGTDISILYSIKHASGRFLSLPRGGT